MAPPRPQFQARMDDLDAHAAKRAEAQAEEANRLSRREAYRAAELDSPGASAPEAWVSGPHTPSWGGTEVDTPEAAPAAELDGTEAAL